jgi:hypothetical protein
VVACGSLSREETYMRTEPWDWPPERRPPPRPRRTPPPEHRTTLYFDGSIRRQRRRSWWPTIGRIVFRAGVSVAATAVSVVLSAVVVGGMWFLLVLFKAASRVDNPYPKIAAMYYAMPPVHARNHEEMVALVRQLYPHVDDPSANRPREIVTHKHRHPAAQ